MFQINRQLIVIVVTSNNANNYCMFHNIAPVFFKYVGTIEKRSITMYYNVTLLFNAIP